MPASGPDRSRSADIADLRTTSAAATTTAVGHRAEARRRVAIGPDRLRRLREPRDGALPDPGDGPGREDGRRRADPEGARRLQRAHPEPGEFSATLFIELTGTRRSRDWLPGWWASSGRPPSAGVTRSSSRRASWTGWRWSRSSGPSPRPPTKRPSPGPRSRPRCTTSGSPSTPSRSSGSRAGPVTLAVDHPEYHAESPLPDDVRFELLTDLRPLTASRPRRPHLRFRGGHAACRGRGRRWWPGDGLPGGRGVLYTVPARAPYCRSADSPPRGPLSLVTGRLAENHQTREQSNTQSA